MSASYLQFYTNMGRIFALRFMSHLIQLSTKASLLDALISHSPWCNKAFLFCPQPIPTGFRLTSTGQSHHIHPSNFSSLQISSPHAAAGWQLFLSLIIWYVGRGYSEIERPAPVISNQCQFLKILENLILLLHNREIDQTWPVHFEAVVPRLNA